MSEYNSICRLCKSTKFLTSLFEMDGDMSLDVKTTICIDLKIAPDDDLPSTVCKRCKKKVRKFYNFKQKCSEVDLELRIKCQSVKLEQSNPENMPTWEFLDKPDYSDISSENEECTDQKSSVDLKLAVENEELTTSIQCELCGSLYKTKAELRKHRTSHRETNYFQCQFCPKRFTRAESNAIHMRSRHLGIRPYICEICGQLSTKRQDLQRHMLIHKEERNHECHSCGRRFKRGSDLCSHIRTHSGLRPYKCNLCEKDYTSHSGLRKHYQIHNRNGC